jgi:hypothetical protein
MASSILCFKQAAILFLGRIITSHKAHLFLHRAARMYLVWLRSQSRYCEYICGATIWPRPDVPTAPALDWWAIEE